LGLGAAVITSLLVLTRSAHAETFTKGPYLQGVDSHGVTIKFELVAPASAKVEVTASDGKTAQVESKAAKDFHAVRITNLTPKSSYRYRVLAGEANEAGSFTTAPEATLTHFKFLVYGDSRSEPNAHAAIVHALESAPGDFLVSTGDLVASGSN